MSGSAYERQAEAAVELAISSAIYPGYFSAVKNIVNEGRGIDASVGRNFCNGFRYGTAFGSDCCALVTCACIPFRCFETVLSPLTDAACCGVGMPDKQPVSRCLNCVVFSPVAALTYGLAFGAKEACCPSEYAQQRM